MELHVRMVACIALTAIGAQAEVAVNVVQRGSRAIVKGATSLGCSCHLKLQQRSSLSSHDHITMTSHTRTLSMTWSSTLSTLFISN